MRSILRIDSSARSGLSGDSRFGSHSRRLTERFVAQWRGHCPHDRIVSRDVGASSPKPVSGNWIHAAFTPANAREAWMEEALAESDELVDELLAADIIVAGVPMYNFGMPAQFKAYIDNIVRVGRTFGFDRARGDVPYWPLVPAGKTLVILSARGDYDYGPGRRLAHMNHVEPGVETPFAYIGITDVHRIAIEYDEFADQRLQASIATAEAAVDRLVRKMARSDAAATAA
ncbi:FMN-dependent NADH-azoreductase [Nisaea sediminum]|uniref:FMN-dependent NADH-azoreductase n=1 Tax=Nisaea sediminum TaxID=2775867 RepID=UPI00186826BD|nr:NAD(P)H-dependent oxidoreductase [Nisaea sediminum]